VIMVDLPRSLSNELHIISLRSCLLKKMGGDIKASTGRDEVLEISDRLQGGAVRGRAA
jgi:hypothetical protein